MVTIAIACPTVAFVPFKPKHHEIDVCSLTSCLRSRERPKDNVEFADPCGETEYMVSDHWNFVKQIIPEDFFGPVERVAVDPYTEE